MSRFLVISGRRIHTGFADSCAVDFEDSLIDGLGADIVMAGDTGARPAESYDLVFAVAVNFRGLAEILRSTPLPARKLLVAYVFGGYGSQTRRSANPLKRLVRAHRFQIFQNLDRLYVGIRDDVDQIAADLGVPVTYLPMAANVLSVSARPFRSIQDRPISVAAFGRQHSETVDAIADRFNNANSKYLFYNTNFVNGGTLRDRERYRAMFWQILRKSQISLCFDHFYAPGKSVPEHSYVGPRWFESLAAGTVVAGAAPATEDSAELLDWQGATIDLPANPRRAVEALEDLLADTSSLRESSLRNISEMRKRHDWRYRIRDILSTEGVDIPDRLQCAFKELAAPVE